MGTRGFVGVVVDNTVKTSYNHWDSYPSGLGSTTLEALRKRLDESDLESLASKARDLKMVDEDARPSAQEIAIFRKYSNPNVGGSLDQPTDGEVHNYYQLLRELQGNLLGMLDVGLATDAKDFPLNSLFCEWGYLVDFDKNVFEVYRGFQTERHDQGRWAGLPTDEDIQAKADAAQKSFEAGEINKGQLEYFAKTEYHSVALAGSWPLDALPTWEEFAKLEASDEDEG